MAAVGVVKELAVAVSKLRAQDQPEQLPLLLSRLDELLTIDTVLLCSTSSAWSECLSLIASGKALSAAAQAKAHEWYANGQEYARWLGKCVFALLEKSLMSQAAQLLDRALSLGYPEELVAAAINCDSDKPAQLLEVLPQRCQKKFIAIILSQFARSLQAKKDENVQVRNTIKSVLTVKAVRPIFIELLTKSLIQAPAALYQIILYSILQCDLVLVQEILEKNWETFGDKLFIKHVPIVQQEAVAQILLIAAGGLYNHSQAFVTGLARSNLHTRAISNRLSSSSGRIRFLGMVVGVTVSSLIDAEDSRLIFDDTLLASTESSWYQSLVRGGLESEPGHRVEVAIQRNAHAPASRPETQSRIEVVDTDDDDEEEDLVPYSKPSDPLDEDDDPTLVERDKPVAPRYIRDLVQRLRDTENVEAHLQALRGAANLIRRKAAFGSEVKDSAEELASVLVSMNKDVQDDNFSVLRSEAMTSLAVAVPSVVPRWYATNYFAGDYSLSQRASILSAMGMSAQELAGIRRIPSASNGDSEISFPSEKLPARLHALYLPSGSNINNAARQLEHQLVQPHAVEAHNKLTGPRSLQILESRPKATTDRPSQATEPSRSRIISENLFFPLIGFWSSQLPTQLSTSPLLEIYVKTLAVILQCCGPSCVALAQMTSEFFALLFSLRIAAQTDRAILEAVLFAGVCLLTVNEDSHSLVRDFPNELVEMHEWTDTVFRGLDEGDSESAHASSLAASILITIKKLFESHHRLLLGSTVDF